MHQNVAPQPRLCLSPGFFIRDASRLPQVNWVRRGRVALSVAPSWEKQRAIPRTTARSIGHRPKSATKAMSQALPHHLIEKQHNGAIQSIRPARIAVDCKQTTWKIGLQRSALK